MLTLLAPGYLFAGIAAAAALVAAHFIVRRQPRAMMLPTARFVPDAPVLTTGWARVPADVAVLTLRVLCVLLAGLALARPVLPPRVAGSARVILADNSRAVADVGEVRDSTAALRAPGDVVIAYAATPTADSSLPSSDADHLRSERGSLSAALVAAKRAASRFHNRADSVELVIISSFATEELDVATGRIRREWPGRARIVRVAAAVEPRASRPPAVVGETGDPLVVAVAASRVTAAADVRIARGNLTAGDSLWARGQPGRVLLHWPMSGAPIGFVARRAPHRAAGLATRASSLVAPFEVRFQHVPALGSRGVAWWIDGDVAAAETRVGASCVRSVAIPVSPAGDFVLRPDFHAVLRDLVEPCGGASGFAPMSAEALAMLAGAGGLAPANLFGPPRPVTSTPGAWLLAASLMCLLLEMLIRGRRGVGVNSKSGGREAVGDERKAA